VSPSQSCASRFLRLGRGTPSDDEWKSRSHLGRAQRRFSSTGKLSRPQTELSSLGHQHFSRPRSAVIWSCCGAESEMEK